MEYPVFKQENYTEELGVGQGYSIAKFGCALCSVCSVVNWYGRSISPLDLNNALVSVQGFAANGTQAPDGTPNKTLLVWSAITSLYGEIKLEQNIAYPTTPADMGMVDAYLIHNMPVVVGVSFTHDPKQTVPSHYVVLYKKQDDGTYLCFDPWFGDRVVFNTRYAVNGMTPANAILQVVAYNGPIPQETLTTAPPTASQQAAVTPTDNYQKEASDNWNLYLQEVDLVKQKGDRIQELETQVQGLTDANSKLTEEIGQTKALNSTLFTQLATIEKADSQAVEEGKKAMEQLKQQQEIVTTVSGYLKTKPTLRGILQEIDSLFMNLRQKPQETPSQAVTITKVVKPAPKTVLEVLGISKGGE